MADISFLPENLRQKEEEMKKQGSQTASSEVVSMHVPETEEEDVEIIEVDASEVDQMLIGEPLYTRLYYKASLLFETLKEKYFAPRPEERPAKAPPQFFKPPKAKEAPAKPGEAPKPEPAKAPAKAEAPAKEEKPTGKPKARIRPEAAKPRTGRRVRIIKRVRKPVHVSLLDEQTMRDLHINIPKRKFTLVFLTIFFAVVFAGAFLLLDQAIAQAAAESNAVQRELAQVRSDVKSEQDKWRAFQDLEPRLLVLNDLLDSHVSANNVLDFLEQNTLVDVSYSSFMMSEDGRVNLGVTASSYAAAARQLLIFEESPQIASAQSNSFTAAELEGDEYVTFQLILELEPEALLFKSATSTPSLTD
ncbi:hypothetical protein GF391_04075 [Candidatus Uhrbacteria bacterium]|nr:hypothetical protein [Candidatus Uhrbacteria bacterium]